MSQSKDIMNVGLDAHAKTINVAVVPAGAHEVEESWEIAHNARSLTKLSKRLLKMNPQGVRAAYEAGACGFALQRKLVELGIECVVVAPSLIPVKPGERVKTDRRDACKLATLLRAELLTQVHPPNEAEEALRDLMRARENAKKDLQAARHRVDKMLLRHGLRFTITKNWTHKHRAWLKTLHFEEVHAQQAFDNYLLSIEQIEARLAELNSHIEAAATEEAYAEKVGWLRCLRGVDTVIAMTILAELHDFRRFRHPRDLMSYLGLTPREYSSGGHSKRGSITKTGNSHVRRALVEAAWSYRHRPAVSALLGKRRRGQPAEVVAIADRAQHRLHKRYYRLKEGYKKPHNVVTVALARELVGFIWAILMHQEEQQAA